VADKRQGKPSQENLRAYKAAIRELLKQISERNQRLSLMKTELSRIQEELVNPKAALESELSERLKDPLGRLLWTYSNRPDLQQAFPEVIEGDYSHLLDWAKQYISSGKDEVHQQLRTHADWYQNNPLTRMRTTELELTERAEALAAERTKLSDELNGVRGELSSRDSNVQALEAEMSRLSEELNRTKSEFDVVRHSFGYKFMKFYARIIDALLPDGTTRGELKKTSVASFQVLTEQGVASLSRQILVKMKRREFTIVDPATKRPTKAAQSPSIPATGEFNDDTLQRELQLFLSKNDFLQVPSHKSPRVSIVIVTYNKAHYAYRCLRCLLDGDLPPLELIVVDNASSDRTVDLLRKIKNASVIMNSSNQFFARANNQGASAAKGEYLLFLNQDAFIHKGCVSSLMRTLDSSRDIGAVGAKLVARDGRLLEAGSIIWRDGSCLGYGRGDDPGKPEYCYVRDVDYSSAACLMVRRDAFQDLAGFDENFIPAYYEDTDLCMRLWERGLRVVYQPLAVATHLEFSSSSLENATKLMARQQHAFVHKHESALLRKSVPTPANVLKARDKSDRSRILVVDDRVPKPIEGSGFPRMFSMLKAMASLGYRVTLLPSVDGTPKQPETEILTQMGIEVLWGTAGIREILNSRPNYYDVALISRPHNALFGIDLVRATNPKARIIYDAEALWYRRENLKRRLGFPSVDARFESEDFEISLIQKADYVIAVSNLEKSILQDRLQDKQKVLLIGHTHTNSPTSTSFEDRRGLLFLGGFMSAQGGCGPNDDAAVYFAKTIFPHIKKKIPEIHFIIAGSDAPKSVWQLASESVSVLGYVQDLRELYAKARVFVVPIRFGAGAMWKVTEAMSLGLPCVLSAVAAEGLEIKDGEDALIACDEGEFIEKTIQLYNDKALWADVRKRALDYVARNCDPTGMEEKLDHLLRQASRAVKR
jgi:GT2 family glycosyltransferase